jgi:hypothetical protein
VLKVAAERAGRTTGSTLDVNPGEVWEEVEMWIDLSWRIDPDGSLGIRKHFESPSRPGQKVSTDEYYAVCRDLIAEVSDLFGKPRFFHLGMDEETAEHQRLHEYVVIRQFDLWWRDLLFYVQQAEANGARAWVWSDYVWHHPETFYERMPKSVLQSNWYYESAFSSDIDYVKAYNDLESHGYDQVPTGSNWSCQENFGGTVEYCRQCVEPERLLGFMQTVWRPTLKECEETHMQAIELAGRAIAAFKA